jgi:hypothetical protein
MADGFFKAIFCSQPWHFEKISQLNCFIQPSGPLCMADGFFEAIFCSQPWHFEKISQLNCFIQPSGYFFYCFVDIIKINN